MTNPPFHEASVIGNTELLERIRELMLPALAGVFDGAQAPLGQELFRIAGSLRSGQGDYLEAITQLRREREPVVARFRAHLARAWQALEAGRPLSAERLHGQAGAGFALVSEQDMDVRLAVRNLAGAIQHRWRPELMRLERYLGLVCGLRVDGDTDPLGPEHIALAVQQAYAPLTLAAPVQLAIVRRLEAPLVAGVGGLYATLQARLQDVAHLRELPEPRARRRGIPRDGQGEAEEAQPDWIARFFAEWAVPGEDVDAIDADDAPDTGAAAGEAIPRVHLPEPLQQLLRDARRHEEPDQAAAAGRRILARDELVSALSLLQMGPGAGFGDVVLLGGGSLGLGLRRAVQASAASLGLDAASTRLHPLDADALDLVGRLFETVLEQSTLQPPQRELLGRLLVPLAKVALLDPGLFVRDGHPARRLLNLVADACDGNGGATAAEQAMLEQVQEAVDQVVADYHEHLGPFLAAALALSRHYEQFRRKAEIAERRAGEMQRAEERRAQARALADQAWREHGRARALPPAFAAFLAGPWRTGIEQLALREDGAGLVRAMALGEIPGEPQARRRWLHEHQAALLALWAGQGLAPDRAQDEWEALATACDQAPVPPADVPAALPSPQEAAPEAATAAAVASSVLIDPAETEAGFDHVTADYFRSLPLGTWLDFVDRQGRRRPGKLAWISPISGRRMFVDRSGARLHVVSPEELALMVQLQRVALHRDEDAFYAAMQAAVDRLERPVAA
jgi:hypothetical protein